MTPGVFNVAVIIIFLVVDYIVELELQYFVAAEDGDVFQVGTLLIVHPRRVIVGFVECVARTVVVAVDISAFDMYFQVIVIAQLVGKLFRILVIGVYEIVDIKRAAIVAEGHDVETALQADTVRIAVVVVGHLGVSYEPCSPQLGTLFHFALYHDVEYATLVGVDTGGVVHIGVALMAYPFGDFTGNTVRLDELYTELLGIVAVPLGLFGFLVGFGPVALLHFYCHVDERSRQLVGQCGAYCLGVHGGISLAQYSAGRVYEDFVQYSLVGIKLVTACKSGIFFLCLGNLLGGDVNAYEAPLRGLLVVFGMPAYDRCLVAAVVETSLAQ